MKKSSLGFGIGKKLLIYFLMLSMVPLIIGGSISYIITKGQLEESTKALLTNLARDLGRKISYYVDARYHDIRLLFQADVFKKNDTAAKQQYIEKIIEVYPFYDAISVIDMDGTIVACTRKEVIGESRAEQEWFQRTIQCKQGDVIALDAYRAETAGKEIVIGFNVPITDGSKNTVIGVLATRVNMDHIVERVQALDKRTGLDNHVYLLDKTGEILAGPDEKQFLTLYRLHEFTVVRDLLAGKTGIKEYENDRGEYVISAHYALKGEGDFDGWGWGIIATQPISKAFRAAYLIRNTKIILALAIALLASFFAVVISEKLTKPIRKVSESAKKISKGDLNPIKINYFQKDEIGDLVDAFNKMTGDLYATTVSRDTLKKEIAERKQVEVELRDSEEKFRVLSEQSMLGVFIIQDGMMKYANKAFFRIIEYSTEDNQQRESDLFALFVHPEDYSFVLEQIRKKEANSRNTVNSFQFRILTKRGALKWAEMYSKVILYKDSEADMMTIVDVTQRKKTEDNAKIQQQQLIEADKLASLGVLVAGVAHEINNPNQVIMSNARLLTEAWKSIVPILEEFYKENGDFVIAGLSYTKMRAEMPIYFEGILDGAKRVKRIVGDLKSFARREDGNMTEDVDINLVAKAAITLASNFIRKATESFNVKLAENMPKIKGNFQRLDQVILNLIQNACQALPDKKRAILVTTAYDEDSHCVDLSVRDEGVGIPLENLSRVKDPFFTTRRTAGGTGLGLSVASTIIEEHQGTMVIASEPGRGTMATIKLPVKRDTGTEEAE